MKQAFDLFDNDKSGIKSFKEFHSLHKIKRLLGSISTNELGSVVKSLSIKASDDDIKKLMKAMDADNSGLISFEEFR